MSSKLKIDIVIPGYYSAQTTLRAVKSVVRHSNDKLYDLKIILSEDSADPNYADFLTKVLKSEDLYEKIVFIKREQRGGFIENCYTGIEYRDSDYKVLLNSDTMVTEGWLEPLIELAESEDKIAIVNPTSNNAPILSVPFPPGSNVVELAQFFRKFRYSSEEFLDITTSVGFCMVIKSKYIKEYGFFDRIFGMGYCEETDLHFRFLSHGLRALIAPNSFVYHRGEGSFSGDRKKLIEMNQTVFFERWGKALEKDLEKYTAKTIMHRVRQSAIESGNSLNLKVLFITESDNLNETSNQIAHHHINSLNESNISANMICTREIFTQPENNEDRTYTPLPATHLDKVLVNPQIFVFTSFRQLSQLKTLIKSSKFNTKYAFLLSEYTQDSDREILNKQADIWDLILNYTGSDQHNLKEHTEVVDIKITSNLDLTNYIFKENKLTNPHMNVAVMIDEPQSKKRVIDTLATQKSLNFKIYTNFTEEIFKSNLLITDKKLNFQELSDLETAGVIVMDPEKYFANDIDRDLVVKQLYKTPNFKNSEKIKLFDITSDIEKVLSQPSTSTSQQKLRRYIELEMTMREKIIDFIKSIASR